MINQLKKPGWAVLFGVIITLVFYLFFQQAALGVVVGIIAGIYLIRPASLKLGAAYGALIAFPLGLYINIAALSANSQQSGTGFSPLINALLHVFLSAVVGALYGLVFVWLTNRLTRGSQSKA